MAGNADFFSVPGASQNTMIGESNAQNVLSHPGFTFTDSLSPSLAAQYQPPQVQTSLSAPYCPSYFTISDTDNSQSYFYTHTFQNMQHTTNVQHTTNMQPHQLQQQPSNPMAPTSSPYSAMYPSGSAFGPAQVRGMPGPMIGHQQQQQQMPSFPGNMPSGTSLTTHQRPMAQAHPPSARAQQLQSLLRTPSNAVRTSSQQVSTPRMQAGPQHTTPSFEQRLAAQAQVSPYATNTITPPASGQYTNSSPIIQNQPNMSRPNALRSTPAGQAPQTASPVQPSPSNMTNGDMGGQKRPADDFTQAIAQNLKARKGTDAQGNQVVAFSHPTTGQPAQMSVEQFEIFFRQFHAHNAQKKKIAEARKAEQRKNELARLKALADEQEKKNKAAAAKAQAEQAEKSRLAAIELAEKEKQKQIQEAAAAAMAQAAKEKAEHERQVRIVEAEKKKRLAAEQKAWREEEARKVWLAQEARREAERKILRQEQLRKDPSALYRHYREYLQFYPVRSQDGRTNTYLWKLLANRSTPADETEELAQAIHYAKDNWQLFLEYPRDVEKAAKWQKEALEGRRTGDQRLSPRKVAFAKSTRR